VSYASSTSCSSTVASAGSAPAAGEAQAPSEPVYGRLKYDGNVGGYVSITLRQ
jgi:hypothetical protein